MRSILFLCTGNSCRSQMAEGFARRAGRADVRVSSAGTHPKGVHPFAVRVMREAGVDIGAQRSKDLSEIPLDALDLVVTLCGDARDGCPVLPPHVRQTHWPLPDPALAEGSEEAILAAFREVRDEIARRVEALLDAG